MAPLSARAQSGMPPAVQLAVLRAMVQQCFSQQTEQIQEQQVRAGVAKQNRDLDCARDQNCLAKSNAAYQTAALALQQQTNTVNADASIAVGKVNLIYSGSQTCTQAQPGCAQALAPLFLPDQSGVTCSQVISAIMGFIAGQ
jgi:hypothetical protein